NLHQLSCYPRSSWSGFAGRAGSNTRWQPETTWCRHSGEYAGQHAPMAEEPAARQARCAHAGLYFYRRATRPSERISLLATMHGTTMIFLVVMPVGFGFVNYVLPLQIGARDMAFPRLNAFGFWCLLFGGLLLHFSVLAGGAPAVGWFSYAPMSETPYSSSPGVDYWAIAIFVM